MINIFETSFEARERRFQIEKLYHGETVDLVGVVTTNGVPQNITGYSVTGVFQPTSMNGSPDFYELSADIVDNKVVVHWEKGKDFGENSYMVWALLTDGDNASYPIVWRLDMAYSPNFPLSALDPIPKAIDFSKYELLNAPWLELSDVQGIEDELSNEVLDEVASKYLPLSGGTVGMSFALNVVGQNVLSGLNGALAIGLNSSSKSFSNAIGYNAKASGRDAVAIGPYASTDGDYAVAIGNNANGSSTKSTAIGSNSAATDTGTAVGFGANATTQNSIGVGFGAKATADSAIQLGFGTNSVSHSLKVIDKTVLSGDNLTLDPERVPYLSNYAKTEDIPEVPTDLSAFTNSPGYLTAHQSLSDYYTKEEADGKFLTAHQDLTDYATKEFVQSEISDFITEDALTGLATKDELTSYAQTSALTAYASATDLETLSNSVGDINSVLDSINGEVI